MAGVSLSAFVALANLMVCVDRAGALPIVFWSDRKIERNHHKPSVPKPMLLDL